MPAKEETGMLTREQIEDIKTAGAGWITEMQVIALCDLALSAIDRAPSPLPAGEGVVVPEQVRGWAQHIMDNYQPFKPFENDVRRAARFILTLSAAPQMQGGDGWIAVGERLPDTRDADRQGQVLMYHKVNGIAVIRHFMTVRAYASDPRDTSMLDAMWQPLPRLPQKAEGE